MYLMVDQIRANLIRKPVNIDRYGSRVSILRKESENLSEYNDRIIKGYKNLFEHDQESFWRSLEYITSKQSKLICELTFDVENLSNCSISINSEKITIYNGEDPTEINLNEKKFMHEVLAELESIDNLSITELFETNNNSWKTLISENLVPRNSEKIYYNFLLDSVETKPPRNNIVSIISDDENNISYNSTENTIINNTNKTKEVSIVYQDFPIRLSWVPFKVLECNSEEFNNVIKDSNGILTQEGAKIVNKILKKQNTYWG
tara:strand:- start:1090 stop:1875 length:786 start_codon:yes stop_codon:yes gene_type:complete